MVALTTVVLLALAFLNPAQGENWSPNPIYTTLPNTNPNPLPCPPEPPIDTENK